MDIVTYKIEFPFDFVCFFGQPFIRSLWHLEEVSGEVLAGVLVEEPVEDLEEAPEEVPAEDPGEVLVEVPVEGLVAEAAEARQAEGDIVHALTVQELLKTSKRKLASELSHLQWTLTHLQRG